MNPSKRKQ